MRIVKVQALKSFDAYQAGDEYLVYMTEGIAHLIVIHYLKLLWDPTWELGYGTSSHVPTDVEADGPS